MNQNMINYNYTLEEEFSMHHIHTDAVVLSLNTNDIFKEIKNPEVLIDFSKLSENHELFSNKNKKLIGNFKTELLQKIRIDEFIYVRIKMYAFKRGGDSKNRMKGVSPYLIQKILKLRIMKNV